MSTDGVAPTPAPQPTHICPKCKVDRFKQDCPGPRSDCPMVATAAGVKTPSPSVSIDVLRQHWLSAMECDHEAKRDKPHCACSLVDLGWHPSIGAAVEAWLTHVSGVTVPGAQTVAPSHVDDEK